MRSSSWSQSYSSPQYSSSNTTSRLPLTKLLPTGQYSFYFPGEVTTRSSNAISLMLDLSGLPRSIISSKTIGFIVDEEMVFWSLLGCFLDLVIKTSVILVRLFKNRLILLLRPSHKFSSANRAVNSSTQAAICWSMASLKCFLRFLISLLCSYFRLMYSFSIRLFFSISYQYSSNNWSYFYRYSASWARNSRTYSAHFCQVRTEEDTPSYDCLACNYAGCLLGIRAKSWPLQSGRILLLSQRNILRLESRCLRSFSKLIIGDLNQYGRLLAGYYNMRNKFLSSRTKEHQEFNTAISQELKRHTLPVRNVVSANQNYGEKRPPSPQLLSSPIQKSNTNPQAWDCCVKRRTASHRRMSRPRSSCQALSPSVIAIEWDQLTRGMKNNRGSSIHSLPNQSLILLDCRKERRLEESKAQNVSWSAINYKPHKAVANYVGSRKSPSRSKHYNRMFQLKQHSLPPKTIISYPLDSSFQALRNRFA